MMSPILTTQMHLCKWLWVSVTMCVGKEKGDWAEWWCRFFLLDRRGVWGEEIINRKGRVDAFPSCFTATLFVCLGETGWETEQEWLRLLLDAWKIHTFNETNMEYTSSGGGMRLTVRSKGCEPPISQYNFQFLVFVMPSYCNSYS